MFSTAVRGGKAFAAKQKLRELKKEFLDLKLQKNKSQRVDNMNSQSTTKYIQVPNDIEKNTLSSKASRERFNFSRLQKISREKNRLEKFDKKFTREKN